MAVARRGGITFAGLAGLAAAAAAPAAGQADLPPCSRDSPIARPGPAAPLAIDSGGDLRLAGGGRARLADLLPADELPGLGPAERARLRRLRIASVRALLEAGNVVACRLAAAQDRYRIWRIDLVGRAPPVSLRHRLVAEGLGLVLPQSQEPDCCRALYRAEARARSRRLGVWAGPASPIRRVDPRTGTAPGHAAGFAIVEGWVRSVGARERLIYLNFGRDWSTDFTVTVRRADLGPGESDALADLSGAKVRVRGLIEPWNGDHIRVSRRAQIETLVHPFGRPRQGR